MLLLHRIVLRPFIGLLCSSSASVTVLGYLVPSMTLAQTRLEHVYPQDSIQTVNNHAVEWSLIQEYQDPSSWTTFGDL